MKRQSILIVDDEEIIRVTLSKDMVNAGYDVCTAQNGEEAIACFEKERHDLILIDLVMVGLGGIDVAKAVLKLRPDVRIIILTGYGSRDTAIEALRLGVDEYLITPCDRKIVLEKIKALLENEFESRTKVSLENMFEKLGDYDLTPREMELSKVLIKGQTREEIAEKLFISKNTVDTHVKNIYKKMQVSNFSKLLEKLIN